MKYQILVDNESRRPLTRNLIRIANGDTVKYDKLCEAYDQEFQPSGKLQECLVNQLIDIRWRIDHLRTYTERMRNPAGTATLPPSKARRELATYERNLLKQYEDTFSDLCRYQSKPQAA